MKKRLIWPVFIGSLLLTGCTAGAQALTKADPVKKFVGDYNSSNEWKDAAKQLNAEIAREGFVLLKNKDNALPFGSNVHNISVFGKSSTDIIWNGGGSGSGRPDSSRNIDLQTSLTEAGFALNSTLTDFYKDKSASGDGRSTPTSYSGDGFNTVGETPIEKYTDAIKASFANYNDAAIIVISRSGTEGADDKACDARDFTEDGFSERHYLQLSKNEEDMFEMVKENFNKIVVLINSGNVFECQPFEEEDKVVGILWIGTPGTYGLTAVGEILNGTVNPSGRTVDTWGRDFTKDPTFENFSDNAQTNLQEINGQKVYIPNDTMLDADGVPVMSWGTDAAYTNKNNPRWEGDGTSAWGIHQFPGGVETCKQYKVVKGGINGVKPASYVSYEEGVYVDYRYYETRYQDMAAANKAQADQWYASEDGVLYPFGYGLSYTTFSQEITKMNYAEGSILNPNCKTIELEVKVKNTGNVAGKDVVQIYWKAPYKSGEIEKADHVLCAFDKTEKLEPGEEQTLKLSFYLQDVANYDYNDANHNGFKGYELDGGDYSVILAKDAHEFYGAKNLKVQSKGIQYATDRYTDYKVENRFTDNGFYSSLPSEKDVEFTHMSRANFAGTFPRHPSMEDRTVDADSRVEEFYCHPFNLYDLDGEDSTYEYMPKEAHKTKEDIEALGWSQQETALAKANRTQLSEMKNIPMDDPRWTEFLNEFTFNELSKFTNNGNWANPSMNEIGKQSTSDQDGPNTFNGSFLFAGEPIMAATFNVRLATERGQMVGYAAQTSSNTYGWLGAGCNTHRSPFGGRNFEYFSADPFLMGKICARVVGAATDMGVYCYFKHFAVNDQEKGREGISTFVSEQALREIYLKSFQMVVQEGKSRGIMSSYNRLGLMETAASYPLLTEVLRNEWGFKGAVLSDMTHYPDSRVNNASYENINNRTLAGCNSQLDGDSFSSEIQAKWNSEAGCPVYKYEGDSYESYSWWYAVRKCAMEELWVCANCGITESLTLSTDNIEAEDLYRLRVGEAVNERIAIKDGASGELSIDEATPLPAGLSFSNGVISGTPTKDCTCRVNVILTNGSNVKGKIVEFLVLPANGEAGDLSPADPEPEQPKKKKGCFGEIGIASIALVSVLGLAFAGVKTVKGLRKKDEE